MLVISSIEPGVASCSSGCSMLCATTYWKCAISTMKALVKMNKEYSTPSNEALDVDMVFVVNNCK